MKRNPWFGLLIRMLGSLTLLALVDAANAQGGTPPDQYISIQPLAPKALNAVAWYDGLNQYSTITNCASL